MVTHYFVDGHGIFSCRFQSKSTLINSNLLINVLIKFAFMQYVFSMSIFVPREHSTTTYLICSET